MNALLFGSIGTLSDTSELQREAFNEAFRTHGLDWTWDRKAYRDMLRSSGGKARIAAQADAEGIDVDAGAIHDIKSALFQKMLDDGRAEARPGVRDALKRARDEGRKLGFVTTTDRANVDRLLAALGIAPSTFDIVTSRDDATNGKPAPDIYELAARRLAVAPRDCLVVEDNSDGVRAALAAGMACIAWPNANTKGHDFTGAQMVKDSLPEMIFSNLPAAR